MSKQSLPPRLQVNLQGIKKLWRRRLGCWFEFTQKYYNISTSSQYVTLDNKIKCLSLAFFFLFFGNPTNRTVTLYTWELLIANHLDQSKILSCSQVQLITLFFGGAQLCCAFYQPWQTAWIWCKKTSFLS